MTIFIPIAIISANPIARNYSSEIEEDFFFHCGKKSYTPSIRVFTLEDRDEDYLGNSVVVSIYDEESRDLYTFLSKGDYSNREISITYGDSVAGIAKRILSKIYQIDTVPVNAVWKKERFYFIEETFFRLSELDPLEPTGEYPGLYPGQPGWTSKRAPRKQRGESPGESPGEYPGDSPSEVISGDATLVVTKDELEELFFECE